MNHKLKSLFKPLIDQPERRKILLDQMLAAYRHEAHSSGEAIDGLERKLKARLRFLPTRAADEFSLSLDAAILSMRGWLIGFTAVALLLFSLSLASNFQPQPSHGLEEVLTYNVEGTTQDPLALSSEQEYGR